ncbi:MAG: hypothetical protein L6R41_002340 [Letrouitia leprolyta]|nr:MAG: hypothetical protein L6R41_002340 [Letrouitia leprolyta]
MKVFAHSSHLLSTAEALQRVFLPSVPLVLKTLPLHDAPRHRLPIVPRRQATFPPSIQSNRFAQSQDAGPPRDEAIGSPAIQIQVPDSNGLLQPPRSLRDTLASIDRHLNFLVHVGDKVHPRYANEPGPEEGQPDTRPKIPVCKIISKADYRLAEYAKQKPKKSAAASSKELEVHWSMAPNDLKHRLEKLKEFLEQGRRVEVVFGKKRKGWRDKRDVSDEGAKQILKQIRDAVAEVEGAKEWKEMDGQLRGGLTMFFEAKRERTEVKKKYEGEYKVKKKFQAAHEEKLAGFSPAAR